MHPKNISSFLSTMTDTLFGSSTSQNKLNRSSSHACSKKSKLKLWYDMKIVGMKSQIKLTDW